MSRIRRAALAALVLAATVSVVPLAAQSAIAAGTTYYVSWSAGSDANSGTCATTSGTCGPWKSLGAINSRTFVAGDKILLKSGDTWTGSTIILDDSGAAGSPITLGAYGTGSKPLIAPGTVDSIAVRLVGVGNVTVDGIAVANAYEGVRLEYDNVFDKQNVTLTNLDIHTLTDAYNSAPTLYNHTSSGVSVKTHKTASDPRTVALAGLTLTNSTFSDVGAATWFGGLNTDPSTGFQPNEQAVNVRDVTMSGLSVDQGRMWGFNMLFIDGGKFTNLTATNTGSASNPYGAAGIVAAYANNLVYDRILVRGVARNPAQGYDAVGFDYEGVGDNVTLSNSLIDDTDGSSIFFFSNSNNPMHDINMTNVTLARFGKKDGAALNNSAAGDGWGYLQDIRVLDSTGRGLSSGPLTRYNPTNVTISTISASTVPAMPAPLAAPEGASAITGGTPVAPRNDADAQVGLKFTTPAAGTVLTALGRAWLPGNIRPHSITVIRDSDKTVVANCKVVPTAPTRSNGAKYCALVNNVVLSGSTDYWLVSSERPGGDTWGDSGTTATSPAVTIIGAGSVDGYTTYTVWAPGAHSYGPVDMLTEAPGTVVQKLRLDEAGGTTALDSSGLGNAATISGGAALAGAGASGSSARLDGVDDVISVPSRSDLQGMSALTVSAWVRLTALPSSGFVYKVVGKDSGTAGDYSYRIVVASDGSAQMVVRTANNFWYSAGTVATSATGTLTASGGWVSLVGTYDGSRVRLYVNGALAATGTTTISGAIGTSSAPLEIGYGTASNLQRLTGSVDEVTVRRDALTATAIAASYAGYIPAP